MSGKKHTYKIVEESKEDPLFSVIEKGNVTVQFTMADVEANIRQNEKLVKELKGKLMIEDAKRQNIEANHPFVKDLTPEQCFTVHMYEESQAVCRTFPEKIKEFEESLAELYKDKKDIEDSIGIAVPVAVLEPKPEEPSKAIDL